MGTHNICFYGQKRKISRNFMETNSAFFGATNVHVCIQLSIEFTMTLLYFILYPCLAE